MSRIVVLSKAGCPFCSLLKMELAKRGHSFDELDLSSDVERQAYYALAGVNTVPQLYLVPDDVEFSSTAPIGKRLGGWTEVSQDWAILTVP